MAPKNSAVHPEQESAPRGPGDKVRGNRGWARGFRGPGGGSWKLLPTPPTFHGTSTQVCGLWPFSGGSTRPVVGVPVGQDIETGSTVCCDPFSWFKAGLISSPSMMIFGLQGMGKSSFAQRQIIGLADQGVIPLIAGDLKPDYVQTIQALGGQVMRFGENQRLNVLDQGAMAQAADRIGGTAGETLHEQAIARSATMVATLVQVIRRTPLDDWEGGLLARAIRDLVHAHRADGALPPTLPELAHLLQNPTDAMIASVLADDRGEYWELTKPLNRSLQALLDGPLGRTFAGQTTERLRTDAAGVCVDISVVARQSEDVLASVMLATWSETFAAVEAANALADAGLAPQRHFLTVMDEMWRPMRIHGAGLVDKLDAITRLNRSEGVGHIFITHSLKDMESMDSAADAKKARGFVERSAIIVTAGLAREDLRALSDVRHMSEIEIATVASWSTPPGWRQKMTRDPATGMERPTPPPGAGRVLIKLGQRAGIQTQVVLTPTELALHDTNARWLRQSPSQSPMPGVDGIPTTSTITDEVSVSVPGPRTAGV
ncbi:MAG: ATP/GTP-binding protein [Sporichthyaceae bacterium]